MPRVECSFAHMWFEEKVTEGLVDKLSFSWMRLYSENENVVCCTFQKGDYRCQRHVISKANSLSTMFSSVRSLSCVRLFATPWTAAHQASLSITNSRSLPKLMSIESLMQFSHLILCRPLLLLPPIPRSIRVFSNESTLLMRWPKYWSLSFSIIPSKEIPGLISYRMDWLDLLAVQGTLKSLLQHLSSEAPILRCPSPTSIHDLEKP